MTSEQLFQLAQKMGAINKDRGHLENNMAALRNGGMVWLLSEISDDDSMWALGQQYVYVLRELTNNGKAAQMLDTSDGIDIQKVIERKNPHIELVRMYEREVTQGKRANLAVIGIYKAIEEKTLLEEGALTAICHLLNINFYQETKRKISVCYLLREEFANQVKRIGLWRNADWAINI